MIEALLKTSEQRKLNIMANQIHKRFSNTQIKSLIESYQKKEIELSYILSILGIGRSRFFEILKSQLLIVFIVGIILTIIGIIWGFAPKEKKSEEKPEKKKKK